MIYDIINQFLQRITVPRVGTGSRSINAYLYMGLIGYLLGVIVIITLTLILQLEILVSLFICGLCSAAFLLYNYLKKIITGAEEYIFINQMLLAYGVSFIGCIVLKKPVLPYWDVLSFGIAVLMATGRIGCLKAGCCFGRPCRIGIVYTEGVYAHVRLFPIQLLEALLVYLLTGSGITLVILRQVPGTGLIYFLTCYSVLRFFLEFARGDTERRYLLHLSQAQWTGFFIVLSIIILQGFQKLPCALPLRIFSGSCLVVMLFCILLILINARQFALLLPAHILEITAIVSSLTPNNTVCVKHTSAGLLISCGSTPRHYTLSHTAFSLTPLLARVLGRQLLAVLAVSGRVLQGQHGCWHILINDPEV